MSIRSSRVAVDCKGHRSRGRILALSLAVTVAASLATAAVGQACSVSASVVYVEVSRDQGRYCASGFVFHRSGLVATCYHVVEFADKIRVRLADGRWRSAAVVGTDGINDLAVLRIDAPGLVPLRLGRIARDPLGQKVAAYGHPLCGSLGGDVTITVGEITAVRGSGEGQAYQLHLDAMPGNSGGPLVNEAGEAVAVVFMGVDPVKVFLLTGWLPSEPISFAVPTHRLEEITPALARLELFPRNVAQSTYPPTAPISATAPVVRPGRFWWSLLSWLVVAAAAVAVYLLLPEFHE